MLQSGELLSRSRGHANGEIKPNFQALFKKQRNLDDPVDRLPHTKSLPPKFENHRMSKFFQPAKL